jgi:hypothetical protein
MNLFGLAFSGGGIRSATFNLGILQGLAQRGLLRRFDYLSTVSGGGYIGSWLAAWIYREGSVKKVSDHLASHAASGVSFSEPGEITFLRKYSNYLTPKLGMFSGDTWALIAIYLRNLTLNLLSISAFFLSLLLLPHGAVWFARWSSNAHTHALFNIALSALTFGVFFISLNQPYWSPKKPAVGPIKYPWYASPTGILVLSLLPLAASALLGAIWLWFVSQTPPAPACHDACPPEQLRFLHGALLIASVMIAWFCGNLAARALAHLRAADKKTSLAQLRIVAINTIKTVRDDVQNSFKTLLTAYYAISVVLALVAGCGMFAALAWLFRHWCDSHAWLWHAVSFGAPLVAAVFMMMGTLMIGLMGRNMPDESREWWSRLGGWLLICSLAWTAVCGLAFFSLPAIAYLTGLISLAWIASTVYGVFLGKSPLTNGTDSKKWQSVLATLLPALFVVGLLMFASFLASTLLILTDKDMDPALWKMLWLDSVPWEGLVDTNFYLLEKTLDAHLALLFLISSALAVGISWRVDVNQFSIHLLYRNRLLRGYFGASNRQRQGQPFTGFDAGDDVTLCSLRTGTYDGPYPIVNTALNLVKGKELAWQTRKAAAFMYAPLYCGYTSPPSRDPDKRKFCYLPTDDYGQSQDMTLGTAMAVSGAAASPNMGYHTSPALAFLMTVFNVRLGWWSANPRSEKLWKATGPNLGLWYMMKELFGMTDDESPFVYLSDGGHFENLGVYELLKRRCKLIVACDAGQDEQLQFDDLGNAIRKARVDLGIEIVLDTEQIRAGKKHCALGRITYREQDGSETRGDLVYIKASLCGKEPTDVTNYHALHPKFPHEPTSDQWFDESQFESYRALGLHTALEVFGSWDGRDADKLKEATRGNPA